MPTISIIIPTYNRENTILRAINSVLNQTFKDFELLIIDDGSNDKTKEIVNNLKDPRIKYFYQLNSGVSVARNLGLNKSTGEYITFLDSDDEYLPTKIEKQLKLLKTNKNISFVGCNNLRIINNKEVKIDKTNKKGKIFKELLHKYFITNPGAIMIKRKIIEENICFDKNLKIAEDVDFFLKIAVSGYIFDYVDEALFKYYVYPENISSKTSAFKKLKDLSYVYKKYANHLNGYELYMLGIYHIKKHEYALSKGYMIKSISKNILILKSWVCLLLLISGKFGKRMLDNIYLKSEKNN